MAQRLPDSLENRVLDGDVVAEADLALGRMDVDVDLVRRQVDEDDGGRAGVACAARIGFAQGVGDRGRRGRASVDEDVLVAPRGRREVRPLDET